MANNEKAGGSEGRFPLPDVAGVSGLAILAAVMPALLLSAAGAERH